MLKTFTPLLLLLMMPLVSCGQKGPLYLPQEVPPQPSSTEASKTADEPSSTKQSKRKKEQAGKQDAEGTVEPPSLAVPER